MTVSPRFITDPKRCGFQSLSFWIWRILFLFFIFCPSPWATGLCGELIALSKRANSYSTRWLGLIKSIGYGRGSSLRRSPRHGPCADVTGSLKQYVIHQVDSITRFELNTVSSSPRHVHTGTLASSHCCFAPLLSSAGSEATSRPPRRRTIVHPQYPITLEVALGSEVPIICLMPLQRIHYQSFIAITHVVSNYCAAQVYCMELTFAFGHFSFHLALPV